MSQTLGFQTNTFLSNNPRPQGLHYLKIPTKDQVYIPPLRTVEGSFMVIQPPKLFLLDPLPHQVLPHSFYQPQWATIKIFNGWAARPWAAIVGADPSSWRQNIQGWIIGGLCGSLDYLCPSLLEVVREHARDGIHL